MGPFTRRWNASSAGRSSRADAHGRALDLVPVEHQAEGRVQGLAGREIDALASLPLVAVHLQPEVGAVDGTPSPVLTIRAVRSTAPPSPRGLRSRVTAATATLDDGRAADRARSHGGTRGDRRAPRPTASADRWKSETTTISFAGRVTW